MSRTGIFRVLFALIFLTLTIVSFQGLILSTSPHLFLTISSAYSVQQVNKNACIETHNVANTTFILQRATRFKPRQNTSSIVWRLSSRQDHRRRHSLQDRRIRPIAHQGADQGVCLIISHVGGQLMSSQRRSIRVRENSSLNGNRALDLSQERMIVGKIQGFSTKNHLSGPLFP